MRRERWAGFLGALLVAVCLATIAPTASAVVIRESNGHSLGVAPRSGVSPTSIASAPGAPKARSASEISSAGILSYGGGPVIHSSAPYLIFWDPNREISQTSQALLERYFTDVAGASGSGTNVYSVARQYYDHTGIADYKQTFSAITQAIIDTDPFPTTGTCSHVDPANYPICLTDAQLTAELEGLISARGLPTGRGANAPIYFIVTPATVNICADSVTCADNAICAYHSSDPVNGALYVPIPLFFTAGRSAAQDPKACQADGYGPLQRPNGDGADVAIKYLSHEDNEVLTDPLADGSGWSNGPYENGDECNANGPVNPITGHNPGAFAPTLGGDGLAGTLFNQLVNGERYYVQSEWSNGDITCKLSPTPGALVSRFSVQSGLPAGTPIRFDPSATTSTRGYSSATWSFGDSTPPVFRPDPGPPVALTHSFAATGTYTVTLTIVDASGNLSTASQKVNVGVVPTAVIALRPVHPVAGVPVAFDALSSRHPSGSITQYHWSFGDGTAQSSSVAPHHVYAAPGTYLVTLTVIDSARLSDSRSQVIHVAPAMITGWTRRGQFLVVTVNAPGVVSALAKSVRLTATRTATFKISLTRTERRALARDHRVKLRIRLKFVPVVGSVSTRTATVTLRR